MLGKLIDKAENAFVFTTSVLIHQKRVECKTEMTCFIFCGYIEFFSVAKNADRNIVGNRMIHIIENIVYFMPVYGKKLVAVLKFSEKGA
jgi:hypothetical protein